jgi:UDP-N-acetylglucosamine enolpyruvyl transferase
VSFSVDNKNLIISSNDNIIHHNNKVMILHLHKPSVGATINALLMFCKGDKTLKLYNYARDPYIFNQIDFLLKLGAIISYNDNELIITGTELQSCQKKPIPVC